MTASDRRRPGEQTPKQTGDRGALADWVNEGGSFHRSPRDRDESGDSVADESSAEQKTSYVELRNSDLFCRTPERAARPVGRSEDRPGPAQPDGKAEGVS
jgi:hypothetical protein